MLNSFFGWLNTEELPTKVLEVRSDSYLSRPIHFREDAIVLYGPKTPRDIKNQKDKYFEIVLHKPFTESLNQMYSLFRTENSDIAQDRFIVYKGKIPLYVKITKECTVASLQKICDTLIEHQSWTIAHLVAHFGMYELFNNEDVQKHINDTDSLTGATPLMNQSAIAVLGDESERTSTPGPIQRQAVADTEIHPTPGPSRLSHEGMVAVKSGNVKMTQSLVSLNCCLDTVDFDGNTVFHYAAASNKDIINTLAGKKVTSLNIYNKQGHTPLHKACLADAPDCVRALLLAGADVNLQALKSKSSRPTPGIVTGVLKDKLSQFYHQDMKHGGTPLHWSLSREVVDALIDNKCEIDALDFEGRTALHVMVMRSRLECVIALLSRGADDTIADRDGNRPLHLAVKQSNVSIVQALIVFGSDLEAVNHAGMTARHMAPIEMSDSNYDKILYFLHAVGAQRCSDAVSGCRAGCSSRGEYVGVAPASVVRASTRPTLRAVLETFTMQRAAANNHASHGRLLCLDGGGIRGLILVQILLQLEQEVQKPIIHCFDWVAGTSTGGILALALACGKTLRETQRLYFRMKEYAFVGKRPYPSEPLETILKECLGTETVMTDIENPKLMILALLADRRPVDLHIFRNYQSATEILDELNGTSSPRAEAGDNVSVVSLAQPPPPREQLVWHAARASGAAPSYFRAEGRYLDGGLIGNNPTLDALTELAELKVALSATGKEDAAKKTDLKVVVSCGTGLIPVTKLKEIDVFRPESFWDTARLAWGLSAIGNLLVDQATQSDGRVVDRARAWCSMVGIPYYRFSPQLSADVAMDERLDERLVLMLWETQAHMHQEKQLLKELAVLLTQDDD